MPRKTQAGFSLELPDNIDVNDPRTFLQHLNSRYRKIMEKVDSLTGARGPVTLSGDLDLAGHRIVNLGAAKDSKDAVSLSTGNRRYLINPLSVEQNVTATGSSALVTKATFGIGIETPVLVRADITNHYLVRVGGRPFRYSVNTKTAPTITALILDILKSSDNGGSWSSIFLAGNPNKINVPLGSTAHLSFTTGFAAVVFVAGDMLRIDCLQSGGAAQDCETVLEWR
jgi:hypothetical protein